MADKVVGILGGMGPEATLSFFGRIIAHTPAVRDQEHLRVIIDSNPHVPDRTAAILRGGESPVPLMVAGVEALQRAGADFVVIPCVTAHFFLEELRRLVSLPLVSMFDVTAEHIRQEHPRIKAVGLLGSTGTVAGGHFQTRLAHDGIETVAPDTDDQGLVMTAIYDIKNSRAARSRSEIGNDLRGVAGRLAAAGAQGIVLGCTEIPLVLKAGDLDVPVFDTLTLLARAAIRFAGREPVQSLV
jgi:aspartate racemase